MYWRRSPLEEAQTQTAFPASPSCRCSCVVISSREKFFCRSSNAYLEPIRKQPAKNADGQLLRGSDSSVVFQTEVKGFTSSPVIGKKAATPFHKVHVLPKFKLPKCSHARQFGFPQFLHCSNSLRPGHGFPIKEA